MDIFVNYLFSIAYMQIAVSKLLEAEAKRIRKIAEGEFTAGQMTETNESIKKQLDKLEYLQLILLKKFELIIHSLKIKDM